MTASRPRKSRTRSVLQRDTRRRRETATRTLTRPAALAIPDELKSERQVVGRASASERAPVVTSGKPSVDKPVISEETLVAPVVVPGITDKAAAAAPAYLVLGGISFSHFLNDTRQSLIPSVYPILKENYALDFAQVG